MANAQSLPASVLLQIFQLSMDTQDPFPTPKDDVLCVITHAYPEWRRVALAQPTFWTHIQLPPIRFQHPDNLADVQAPLPSGDAANAAEDYLYGGGDISIIDTVLLPIREHLVALTCLLCGSDVARFLHLPSNTFPALESVSITFIHTLDTPRSPFTRNLLDCSNFTVFENHPALKEATFNLPNEIHPLDLKLPWAKLTKLNLSRSPISPLLFLRIMRKASPSLVEGSFQIEFARISHRPFRPRYFDVLMPCLTSLCLKLTNPSLDTSFFFYLRVSGLQSLRIEKFDDYAGWNFSMFDPFIMHFARTLRVLELADFSPEVTGYAPPVRKRTQTRLHEELENLFTTLPHLEVLRLPPSLQVHTPTIEKLANGFLLPSLMKLELYAVNAEQILWMMKGRNFLSEYYRLQPGSSRRASEAVARMGVKRFRLVKLWVDDCEVESVRVASEKLGLASTLSIGSCRL
ncbi:hypothetical protein NLJ89_g5271 [Agrocybe chaxingu]|uniref:F-box domain-containing protein n=1 Tax=Agrocybe chaxingu TaxID=84603 RepID=A0A9W8K0X8_9AGAR|nr:hypothetical protein NLJ89_g5271 [Agrocybe chaxingu]